jgi:hypothetical protein
VGKKGTVSKGKQPGRVVGHAVGRASDVVVKRVITVEPLVQTVDSEKVSRGCIGGDGPFAAADNGGKVVVEDRDRVFADVRQRREDFLVRKDAGQFEI